MQVSGRWHAVSLGQKLERSVVLGCLPLWVLRQNIQNPYCILLRLVWSYFLFIYFKFLSETNKLVVCSCFYTRRLSKIAATVFLPDWRQRFLRGECKIVRKSRRTRALLLHFDLSSDSQNLSPAVVILPPLATAIYRCCFEQEHRHPGKEIPRQMSHHSHTEMLIRHCHVWHYWTNEIAAAVTKGLSLLELNFDWLLTSSPIWPDNKNNEK